MKPHTHISCLLDNSSSMSRFRREVISGFNGFLADQKQRTPNANLSLTLFSERINLLYRNRPIAEVPPLTPGSYRFGVGTAIYDTMGIAIDALQEEELRCRRQRRQPPDVVICLITDGQDSGSRYYRQEEVGEMIRKQSRSGWEFYLFGMTPSAHQIAEGLNIAIANMHTFSHSVMGTQKAFATMNNIFSSRGR